MSTSIILRNLKSEEKDIGKRIKMLILFKFSDRKDIMDGSLS